jgi:AraC-like DNA-binding protein
MTQWEHDGTKLAINRELITRNLIVKGNDLDEARDAVARIFVDHKLDTREFRPSRPVVVSCNAFRALKLCYFDYGREISISPDQLQDFYLLLIPLSGVFRVRCGATDLTVGAGSACILPTDRDLDMHWSSDATQLIVRIDKRRMQECAEGVLGQRLTRAPHFDLDVNWTSPRLAPLRHAVAALAGTVGIAGLPGFDLIAGSIETTLMLSLLFHHENCMSKALSDGRLSTVCPKIVRRAEAFIEQHLGEPIGVDDIVGAVGGSSRSLFESFNRFRNMSPMRYVRHQRLNKVRDELQNPDDRTRVGTVALNWGFQHKGRFAGEYAKLFGETPSQTLERSRRRLNQAEDLRYTAAVSG